MTGEYGSPVHISCLLLKDFSELKLTKMNDKSNLIQLRNALDKLQSDLITNQQQECCNDFNVIDHAESLIPGRYRHQYVEKKDELLTTHQNSFAALSAFLESSATLIQRHMPDKIIEGTSKNPLTKHEQKKVDELKANLAKIEARTNEKPPEKSDDKPP